ncbi:MAG: NADH-quinone oxidoreductase subunit I [Chloroflexi bacterium]|nr:NADH-quinone oxidoreductase subunit I [Chloroflexota bacterium]
MLGLGIAKGMLVTIKHFFMPPVTIQYPEQRRASPPAFRGAPALVFEAGKARCVGCGICARACPHGVIDIKTSLGPDGKRYPEYYEIEITRCLFCGLCVEACPFKAIEMSKEYELAAYARYRLAYNSNRLHGRTKPLARVAGARPITEKQELAAIKEVAQVR